MRHFFKKCEEFTLCGGVGAADGLLLMVILIIMQYITLLLKEMSRWQDHLKLNMYLLMQMVIIL